MSIQSRRLAIVIFLLSGALLVVWVQSFTDSSFPSDRALGGKSGSSLLFLADTDPYGETDDQSLIGSSFDLRLGGLAGFPTNVANWKGRDVPGGGIERLGLNAYQQVFRSYTDNLGRLVWLRLLATSDWELFYHSPPICYFYNNYDMEPENTSSVAIGTSSLRMRGFAARQGRNNHLVLYTYLWSDKYRDMAKGATMVELVAPFGGGNDRDRAARLLEEFARLIFTDTGNPTALAQAGAPAFQYPVDANLENKMNLLGYDLSASTVQPGERLRVTLYWQARSKMDDNYTVFVHLYDRTGESGRRMLAQADREPFDGLYPTSEWPAGQVVKETYEMTVPADAEAGSGQVEVGMYHLSDMRRLSVFDARGAPQGDSVLLSPVRIVDVASQ